MHLGPALLGKSRAVFMLWELPIANHPATALSGTPRGKGTNPVMFEKK